MPQARLGAAARWTAVGVALGLNFGNAGPIASDLARSFDTGLGSVGLLTTALLVAHAATQLPAAGPVERRGAPTVAAVALAGMAATNLLAAAAPSFALLLLARVLVGCATGPGFVASLEGSRQEGGPLLAGVFGGAATLGIALALAAGSVLDGAGASWRISFLLTAAVAAAALLPLLGRRGAPATSGHAARPHLGLVMRNAGLWRVALLHTATFGTSLVVSAWIVEYLLAGDGLGTAAAGAIGAALLGLAAVGRPVGGLLAARGTRWSVLAVGGALLTAAGLALMVVSREPAVAVAGGLVAGIGFALPFACSFQAAARLEPARAASASALVNLSGAVFALAAAPLVGLDLDHGDGRLSFALLALLAVAAAVANRHPPTARRR
jgi:predicted MFS family arabinose efflux permease